MAQKLLIEGDSDLHFITHLMIAKGLTSPKGYEDATLYKKEFSHIAGSKSKLKKELKLLLKNPNIEIKNLGIVVDADSETSNPVQDTWNSIKDILAAMGYSNIPTSPDSKGNIILQEGKPKVGVWIMPNNRDEGYLEDFYKQMIISDDNLWQKAIDITEGFVKNKENRFKEIALSKAQVHTWLAWQKEPELPLGKSIAAYTSYFDFDQPLVIDFIEWFKNTFEF